MILFSFLSLSLSFPTIQFFSRARQSRFLFFFVLSPLLFLLSSDGPESLHVLSSVRMAKSSGKSAERFALFLTRAAVSPFHSLSHYHPRAHFLRRTFAGVFPLSSRKKFFYNFRIVLFRPSPFFQPRAGRSPRVGFTPPSSAALPRPSVFYFLVFTSFNPSYATSRSLTVSLLSLSFRWRSVFSFGKLCQETRRAPF